MQDERQARELARAYAVTEAIVADRDRAAYERAMRPQPQERPLLTIAPWLRPF